MNYEKELVQIVDRTRDDDLRVQALHGLAIAAAVNHLAAAIERLIEIQEGHAAT